MADSKCADCMKKVKDGSMCTCREGINLKLKASHLRTLWFGIKIGMILGTRIEVGFGKGGEKK